MSIRTVTNGALTYQICDEIAVPHCFTTRRGGVSRGDQESLNLAMNAYDPIENVERNLNILAEEFSFDPKKLILTRQTHSDIVRVVTEDDHMSLCHRDYPECDGLVTAQPGVALLAFTADCTPVLLYDPVTGAVGAVHAGWRGTAKKIAVRAVEKMAEAFGADPKNIRAAIGPNIGQCHFQTHEDVPEAMFAAFGEAAAVYIRRDGEHYYPDLKQLNALALRQAGVERIAVSGDCTFCRQDLYWSYRATQGRRGSQGAVIVCKGVTG